MSLYLFARFHASPGVDNDVQQALLDVLGPTRAEAGCLAVFAYRSVRDDAEFYLHSHWKDGAAFDHHASLSHTEVFIERMVKLIDHPFAVSVTREIG